MSAELEIWNDFESDSMGKIEDAGRIVDGGRIDAHWSGADAPRLFPKHFIGVSEILNHPWLHDSNEALKHFGDYVSEETLADQLYVVQQLEQGQVIEFDDITTQLNIKKC